jgi:dienelactone hydrolase
MPRLMVLSSVLMFAAMAPAQTSSRKDVDITAPDGTRLRATLFAAAKPGPGVLLLHMCNTTRKSWEPVAKGLSETGVHVLTIDNRGFGESGGPRFEGGTPEVLNGLREKWPGDFEAAYQFLASQPGVDKSRIALGGGSCGVTNAVKLAESHGDVKAMVLLAGSTDVAGYNFLLQNSQMPVFTAAAADDEYDSSAEQLMQWVSNLSQNPGSKFEGFPNGKHGTEIFGTHPELVEHIVAFFSDALSSNLKAAVSPRKAQAAAFWIVASQKGGGERAAQKFHEERKRDPEALPFAEFPINLLAYDRLQSGEKQDAIELFKLNAEAYPNSANAEDSLSDGYLATGQKEMALAAEEKCLELLPADRANADFKAQLRRAAEEKIAQLKPGNP